MIFRVQPMANIRNGSCPTAEANEAKKKKTKKIAGTRQNNVG